MDSIDAVAGTTGGKGFAAIKITALGKPKLLLNISEVLVKSKQYYQKSSKSALDQVQVKSYKVPHWILSRKTGIKILPQRPNNRLHPHNNGQQGLDGSVSYDQWHNKLSQLGYTGDKIDTLFSKYDANNDKILSSEERRAMLIDLQGQKVTKPSEI